MRTDKLIAQNLEASLKGLIELKKTYIDDPTVVAQIDVLMEEIKSKSNEGSNNNGSSGNNNHNNGNNGSGKASKKNI